MASPLHIFHTSINAPTTKPTIVLLHGLFSSHLQFAHVTPYLQDYNVLLVDLPGHSRSKDIPFTFNNSVTALFDLITNHSPSGKAHVAGLSLGGFVALELARKHPSVVSSVFSSGATPFRGAQRWLASHSRILYITISLLVRWCPGFIYWWMVRRLGVAKHEDLRQEMKSNLSLSLVKAGYGECLQVEMGRIDEIEEVRIAAVAGALQDDVEMTRQVGRSLKRNCDKSKAFAVKGAVHGWDLQFPELFANGIKSWVEEEEMPKEYEELD